MVRLVVLPSTFEVLSVGFIVYTLFFQRIRYNAINQIKYLQLIIKPKEKRSQIRNTLHRNRIAIIDYLLIIRKQYNIQWFSLKYWKCYNYLTCEIGKTIYWLIDTNFKTLKFFFRSNRSDNVLFHQRKVHKISRPTVQNDVLVFDEELWFVRFDSSNYIGIDSGLLIKVIRRQFSRGINFKSKYRKQM